MMGNEFLRMNLKDKWKDLEKSLQENCEGGSCSLNAGQSAGSNFSHSGKGNKVACLNGMTKQQHWKPKNKEDVEPEAPDTKYVDPGDGPFTAEVEKEEDWTAKELKIKDGYKIQEEIRIDDPLNTANDLSQIYAQMIQGENEFGDLEKVVDHFKNTGQDYDIMVRVDETTKSAAEWAAEIERTADEGLPPEVPDIPPTEGGYSPEDSNEDDLGNMMPFPDLGEPPV